MKPTSSLWGKPDHAELLMPGVWFVDTPSHGGLMIETKVGDRLLSSEARNAADTQVTGFYSYEEDCLTLVALVDCPALAGAYHARYCPSRTKEEFDAGVLASCADWNPAYLAARALRLACAV